MRGFAILLCAVGCAIAAPQYNYSPGHSSGSHSSFSSQQSSFGIGSSSGGGLISGSTGHIGGGGGGSHFGGGQFGGTQLSSGSQSSSGFGVSGGGISNVGGQQQEIITKQFFIHSAPEEQDEVGADKVINLGPGRKHYRVVFIKAPHQGVQAGKVRFVAPANEEKTVIYVLSKKTDLGEIGADVQQAQSEPTKPEVHFIKYKTNEEALHAQKQIQAQYDSLGGTSQVSDEGVAPISSVIGVLGDSSSSSVGGGQSSFGSSSSSFTSSGISGGSHGIGFDSGSSGVSGGGTPAASYLPPSH